MRLAERQKRLEALVNTIAVHVAVQDQCVNRNFIVGHHMAHLLQVGLAEQCIIVKRVYGI